jgi:hypothetical protein
MKIRIEGNSIRLRLRQSEVSQLAEKGQVGESVCLPEGSFQYQLKLRSGLENLEAQLDPEGITVLLPAAWGKAWPSESRVGFEAVLKMEGNQTLYLLVEKDFVCLDRDLAGQEDQYPHPKTGKS